MGGIMEIHGFQKTTLLDFPGHVAATVFVGGCNFRCPFCHNSLLVLVPGNQPLIGEDEVLTHLNKRRGILDGVCITGGEPTLQKDLFSFIKKVKAMDYLMKLDTNGYCPEVLEGLLAEGLLDYVAMDVKASMEYYDVAAGVRGLDREKILESIRLLKNCDIPYEFRTTAVKGLHRIEEFEEIGRLLSGCPAYFIQGFRESDNMIGEGYEAFSAHEMEEIANIAGRYIDKVELRGVE